MRLTGPGGLPPPTEMGWLSIHFEQTSMLPNHPAILRYSRQQQILPIFSLLSCCSISFPQYSVRYTVHRPLHISHMRQESSIILCSTSSSCVLVVVYYFSIFSEFIMISNIGIGVCGNRGGGRAGGLENPHVQKYVVIEINSSIVSQSIKRVSSM